MKVMTQAGNNSNACVLQHRSILLFLIPIRQVLSQSMFNTLSINFLLAGWGFSDKELLRSAMLNFYNSVFTSTLLSHKHRCKTMLNCDAVRHETALFLSSQWYYMILIISFWLLKTIVLAKFRELNKFYIAGNATNLIIKAHF